MRQTPKLKNMTSRTQWNHFELSLSAVKSSLMPETSLSEPFLLSSPFPGIDECDVGLPYPPPYEIKTDGLLDGRYTMLSFPAIVYRTDFPAARSSYAGIGGGQ